MDSQWFITMFTKALPLDRSMHHMNPVYALKRYLLNIRLPLVPPFMPRSPQCYLPFQFVSFTMPAMCQAHRIVLDFISVKIHGEEKL
jgi:hypothetical protein